MFYSLCTQEATPEYPSTSGDRALEILWWVSLFSLLTSPSSLYADSRKRTEMKPSLGVQLRYQHMLIFGKFSPTDAFPNHLSQCLREAAHPDLLGGC